MGIGTPSNKIAEVLAGSPAAHADCSLVTGLWPLMDTGTRMGAIDQCYSTQPEKEIQLTVQRGQEEFQVVLVTERDEQENVG